MNRIIGDSDWRPPFNMWDFFALMREIEKKLPPRYTKYVLVSHELIAMLMEKPAVPVTVEITDSEDGQILMKFTKHECATNATLVEQLAQARADRDQWEATAAEENAKRRELEKQIAGGGAS